MSSVALTTQKIAVAEAMPRAGAPTAAAEAPDAGRRRAGERGGPGAAGRHGPPAARRQLISWSPTVGEARNPVGRAP